MTDTVHYSDSEKRVSLVILAVIGLYVIALAFGSPQRATELIAADQSHHGEQEPHSPEAAAENSADDYVDSTDGDHDESLAAVNIIPPQYFWVVPFVLLLAAIAVLPLLAHTEHWWESNLHRFYVAAGLALVTLAYYALLHGSPVEGHWPTHHVVHPEQGSFRMAWTIFANAMLHEYIPFIVLLFSLYTISGGIRIEGDLQANPMTNATFMAVGGLLASFIGTTGAAMVLIRPLLETNRERKHIQHTVVFFIFVVCNCGGSLLPIGDPPLFLGYLRGVDFTWTLTLWQEWLFVNGVLIVIYLLIDEFYYYRRETIRDIVRDVTQVRRLTFQGHVLNGFLLLGVILSVALLAPNKAIPGTSWHPWLYLREVVQLGLVAVSLWAGSKTVRKKNDFNYHAIAEVAVLFCGIFICMQPALQILHEVGPNLGLDSAMMFFWVTGGLSAVLDNAPTYVVFFETARTLEPPTGEATMAGVAESKLVAISLGAVFCGALTYIGNGPNFMVKAIAEKSGIPMPSFFGYFFRFSLPFMVPVLMLMAWIFLT